jgi:SH3 domain-containing protein
MRILLNFPLVVVFACVTVGNTFGADAIVTKRATLRSDPSTAHPPILTLLPREDVELIETSPTAGYYHVRTSEGEEGWVYSRSLEIVTTSPVAAGPPPVAPTTDGQATATAGVTSNISPTWDKPVPNITTFDGPDGHCDATGDGGDTVTNRRKNRTDAPAQYHEVTWKALQTLPYPVAGKSLSDWTLQQLAQIQPYQGIAVSVVGYLTAIKVEDHGSGESTNCHFTNSDEVDWHMPLVEQHANPETTAIVVETTPRVRKMHSRWTPTALAPWVNSASPVRISGWTMLDPEHRAHLGKYRSTLWEIHPITKIEVLMDGHWVDADELP